MWYQQQQYPGSVDKKICCDLLENIYLCGINNNFFIFSIPSEMLWFAWKYLPLWYQQQRVIFVRWPGMCCDLLENIYLCGINNNSAKKPQKRVDVVICLKISTFVVSTTTDEDFGKFFVLLWFAWKYLPLWYQQQPFPEVPLWTFCCDLLENIYLWGINNNIRIFSYSLTRLWFAWKYLPLWYQQQLIIFAVLITLCCDLLENIYLCGINNNRCQTKFCYAWLWFAWKYLPLWYQQQPSPLSLVYSSCCDLLENIYLCGINNNLTKMI